MWSPPMKAKLTDKQGGTKFPDWVRPMGLWFERKYGRLPTTSERMALQDEIAELQKQLDEKQATLKSIKECQGRWDVCTQLWQSEIPAGKEALKDD